MHPSQPAMGSGRETVSSLNGVWSSKKFILEGSQEVKCFKPLRPNSAIMCAFWVGLSSQSLHECTHIPEYITYYFSAAVCGSASRC